MKIFRIKKDVHPIAASWAWREGRATDKKSFFKLEAIGCYVNTGGCFEIWEEGDSTVLYNINHHYSGWHFTSKFHKYYEQVFQPTQIWRQLDKDHQNH